MPKVNDSLSRILELTREMLEKAEAGAWDELVILESRRGSLITQYLDAAHDAGVDAADATSLHELRVFNDRILDLAKTQRQQLMRTLSDSSHQRHAATCYRQTRTG